MPGSVSAKNGDVVLPDQALHGAVVGDRADDDFVARFEVEGRREHGQSRGAAGRGDAVFDAHLTGEGLFEAADHIAGQARVHDLLEVFQATGAHRARKGLRQAAFEFFRCLSAVFCAFDSGGHAIFLFHSDSGIGSLCSIVGPPRPGAVVSDVAAVLKFGEKMGDERV